MVRHRVVYFFKHFVQQIVAHFVYLILDFGNWALFVKWDGAFQHLQHASELT